MAPVRQTFSGECDCHSRVKEIGVAGLAVLERQHKVVPILVRLRRLVACVDLKQLCKKFDGYRINGRLLHST